METARWPRETFLLLAAVGWADGRLDAEEADAIATWIAGIDGTLGEREKATLDVLGFTLRLTPRGRVVIDEAVRELRARPEGDRLARFDLAGLRCAIAQKVDAALAAARARA